jgi:hypothetical protein
VPAGIVTVLRKIPLLRIVVSPDIGVRVEESILKESAVPAGKLEPLTTTSVPAGPEAGDNGSRAAEAVTVNVALAVVEPAVTVTVCGPAEALEEMVTMLVKAPVVSEDVDPEVGVIPAPSNANASILLAGKLEPVIVTDEPAITEVGLKVMVGLPIIVKGTTKTIELGVLDERMQAQM